MTLFLLGKILGMILGFIAPIAIVAGIVYNIVQIINYKSAQDLAPIRLPLKKIKEFYNLAPEKYSINFFSRAGIFTYTPDNYMMYTREHIMCNSYIGWLRSLWFVRQIKHNKITTENNSHVKDYLQYVLKDAQALQIEAQKQIDYTISEMQKPPVDSIISYCENNKPIVYDFEMGVDPNNKE